MPLFHKTLLFTAALALAGCGSSSSSDDSSSTDTDENRTIVENCAGGDNTENLVFSLFDASADTLELPFPNDLYMGSDGTLNMPLPVNVTDGDYSNPFVAMNTLDGFSTTAPISMNFSADIDAATVCAGTNVRVYQVSVDDSLTPTAIVSELVAGTDYEASISSVDNTRLLVKPLLPLAPKTAYLVTVTDGLSSTGGGKFAASTNYAALAGSDTVADELASAKTLVQAQQSILLSAKSIANSDVVVSFSFSTQSITDVLVAMEASAAAVPYSITRATDTISGEPLTSSGLVLLSLVYDLTFAGQADIYTGTIDTPYYLNIPANTSDNTVNSSYLKDSDGLPLTRNSTTAVASNTALSIPMLITLPNTSITSSLVKPAAGWPVAIYQHGSGGTRANALLIADALAAQGIATIAIDQPMHGILPDAKTTDPALSFIKFDFYDAANERHFNLDLDEDSVIDAAGAYFSSNTNMLTGRASYRQAVSDLMHLVKTIPSMTVDGDNNTLFDASKIQFVGLSLGSMVGIVFGAVNTDFNAASLSAPGAGGIKGGEGAPNFNPSLVASLATIGLVQGTIEYEDYMAYSTTITDASDTINFAALANANHPIHMTEIIGDGVNNLPDQTVPNHVLNNGSYTNLVVETAPLAGTDALIKVMGLTAVSASTESSAGVHAVVRFTNGGHQSQVDPTITNAKEVTIEIHAQTASFLASEGKSLPIADASNIEAQ